MRHQNTVFHSVLKLLPLGELEGLIALHGADDRERGFDTKSHLVALLYAQFSGARSLREISDALKSHSHRLYHLGVTAPCKTTFAEANRQRERCMVFSALLDAMLKRAGRAARRAMHGVTYLVDATAVKLNARSAGWARFSATTCGAKLHIVYDPGADRPVYWAITPGNVNDITAAKAMPIVPGATYVYDLGFYDYGWWAELDSEGCRWVTRLKRNTPLRITEERAVTSSGNVLADRIGRLPERQARSRKNPFQKPVREIDVRIDSGKELRIVTNDLTSPAEQIAELYRQRWAIELFFRWIKQTLQLTKFLGTSETAIRAQIAVALIAFLLLRVAQATQSAVTSPLTFARLVRAHLLHRRDLRDLLGPPPMFPRDPNQLVLV